MTKVKWSSAERFTRAVRSLEKAKAELAASKKFAEQHLESAHLTLGKLMTSNQIIDPSWPWVADKAGGLTIGGIKYNRGCEIPSDVLKGCGNFRILQDRKYVRQLPKVGPVKPIKLAEPPKDRALPELRFAAGNGDALEAYRGLKRNFLIDLVGESFADGFDALLESGDQTAELVQQKFENVVAANDRASQIYRVALRLSAENHALQHHLTGRRPVQRI